MRTPAAGCWSTGLWRRVLLCMEGGGCLCSSRAAHPARPWCWGCAGWSTSSSRRRATTGRLAEALPVADDLREPIAAMVAVAEEEATARWQQAPAERSSRAGHQEPPWQRIGLVRGPTVLRVLMASAHHRPGRPGSSRYEAPGRPRGRPALCSEVPATYVKLPRAVFPGCTTGGTHRTPSPDFCLYNIALLFKKTRDCSGDLTGHSRIRY
jgi:hypothetical protein